MLWNHLLPTHFLRCCSLCQGGPSNPLPMLGAPLKPMATSDVHNCKLETGRAWAGCSTCRTVALPAEVACLHVVQTHLLPVTPRRIQGGHWFTCSLGMVHFRNTMITSWGDWLSKPSEIKLFLIGSTPECPIPGSNKAKTSEQWRLAYLGEQSIAPSGFWLS